MPRTLLRQIAAQGAKHIAFHMTSTRPRPQDHPWAQKLGRLALRAAWQPVDPWVSLETEADHVLRHFVSGMGGS